MRSNFLISVNAKAAIPGNKSIFIAEPYVYHFLSNSGSLGKYDNVSIAEPLITTKEDILAAHEFIHSKYEMYVPILAERLNRIHNRSYETVFWKKSLSLGLIRYLTLIDQIFQLSETYFKPAEHIVQILSKECYTVPSDFNRNRELFQYTSIGQEQLFSIYMNLFYPGVYPEFKDSLPLVSLPQTIQSGLLKKLSKVSVSKITEKVRQKVSRFISLVHSFTKRRPVMGIMGCFFSAENSVDLMQRGQGKLVILEPRISSNQDTPVNMNKRTQLSAWDVTHGDRFDLFFWESLRYCMPKEFIENFEEVEMAFGDYFKKFSDLQYVVNETWIGDSYASIGIALLQHKGVKHIYNEHNYLSHQFLGKNSRYIFPLVDVFLSLGWYDNTIKNLEKGGSLYAWVNKKTTRKAYDILMIDGLAMVKPPEYNTAYGDSGPACARRYCEFNDLFLSALSSETRSRVTFKTYPVGEWVVSKIDPPMVSYNFNDFQLKEHLANCKSVFDKFENSKSLIAKSRLVVINYLSTSYIESLIADVPTVFFWNQENYLLEEKYKDFYSELCVVGICQVDPLQAALFVEKIKNDPDKWWQSEPVIKARKNFIKTNLGDAEISKRFLLKLANRDVHAS